MTRPVANANNTIDAAAPAQARRMASPALTERLLRLLRGTGAPTLPSS